MNIKGVHTITGFRDVKNKIETKINYVKEKS